MSHRDLGPRSGEVIHPIGALAVPQKIVPLNLPLDRFGARRLEGGNIFTITDEIRVGVEVADDAGARISSRRRSSST